MINVIKNSKYLILLCLLMMSSITYGQTPGSRYNGTYKKSGPIQYKNKSNIIIEGIEISNTNRIGIALYGCKNVIIRNCKLINFETSVGIYIEKGSNITIEDCHFENIQRGVLVRYSEKNIKIDHNDFKNITGDGNSPGRSNGFQFINCYGAGNSISYNVIENIKGESSPVDIINLFNSHGTPESPIMVKGNWIRGGGPSRSGGGIDLGDHGGSYQIAEDNILVNPGQVGMGMAGGNNLTIRNNKIFGKKQTFTNVGLAIVNWTYEKTGPSHNIIVENNKINWTNRDNKYNTAWFSNGMRDLVLDWRKQSMRSPEINESILPKIILGIAKNSEDNKPSNTPPSVDESDTHITDVYINSFNKIAIKYFTSSTPHAYGELFSSDGKLIKSMILPRFNTSFPDSQLLPRGLYSVRITYKDLGKTETTKVTIK